MIKKLHVLAVALLFSIPLLQAQTDPGLSAVATPSYCTDNGAIRITYTGTTVPDNYAIAPDPYDPATVITSATTNFTGVAPGTYQYGYTTPGNFVRGPATVTVTTVADSPPVFDRGATSEICGDPSPLAQPYSAVDPYGRAITYTMNPSGNGIGTINSTTGTISWSNYTSSIGSYFFTGGEVTITATVMGCSGPISTTHVVNKQRTSDTVYITGDGPWNNNPVRTVCQGEASTLFYAVSGRRGAAIQFSVSPAEAGTITTLPMQDTGAPYGYQSVGRMDWNPDFYGSATITGTTYGCDGAQRSTNHTVTVQSRADVGSIAFELGATSEACAGSLATYRIIRKAGVTTSGYTITPAAAGYFQSGSSMIVWMNNYSGTAVITASARGCDNSVATATHTVTVHPRLPKPSGSDLQYYCIGAATVADLAAIGTGIKWYTTLSGGTPLDPATLLTANTHYWATQTHLLSGCESKERMIVLVRANPAVGKPVFALGATSYSCSGSIAVYTATAANTTAITYSITPAIAGIIDAVTGTMTWDPAFSGFATITATVAGCGIPQTENHTVTVLSSAMNNTPPVFDRGATSEICGNPGNIIYDYNAVDPYGRTITYTMNPSGSTVGNINSTTGNVIWIYQVPSQSYYFSGDVTITATVTGCDGTPIQATHVVSRRNKRNTVYFKGKEVMDAYPLRSICQGEANSLFYAVTGRRGGDIVFSITPPEAGTIVTLPLENMGGGHGYQSSAEVTWNTAFYGVATITGTTYGCEGAQQGADNIVTVRARVDSVVFDLGPASSICTGATASYYAVGNNAVPVSYTITPAAAGTIRSVSPTTGASIRWNEAFSGEAVIIATATACNGSVSATHTVTVHPLPGAPTADATQTFCDAAAPTVAQLIATGTHIKWYTSNTGTTRLDPATALVYNRYYYGSQTDPVTGCESTARVTVRVLIYAVPPTPTAPSPQTVCMIAGEVIPTIADVVASGTNVVWYSMPTGGTALAPSVPLANNTTYYAASRSVGCESEVRLPVVVQIKSYATVADFDVSSGEFCSGETATFTATTSVVTNPVFNWYTDENLLNKVGTGATFTTPPLTANRFYYVTVQGDDYCENNPNYPTTKPKQVRAMLKPQATAADIDIQDQIIEVCPGEFGNFVASSLTVINPVFKWYEINWPGETYTLLHTGPIFAPPTPVAAGDSKGYVVTVSGANKCPIPLDYTLVKGVIRRGKSRAVAGYIRPADQTICNGTSADLLLKHSLTSPSVMRVYRDSDLTDLLFEVPGVFNDGAVFTTPVLTANTTYYVTVSDGTTCENLPGTAKEVTVTVTQDIREEDRIVVLCGSSVLVTAPTGYDTYLWTDDSTGSVMGNDPEIILTAEGNYTLVASSACAVLTEKITVISFLGQTTNPIAIFGDDTAICPNDLTEMVKIALCGAGDSRVITIAITDADSISWQQLDEGSCTTSVPDNCASIGPGCAWTERATGNVFSADTAGQWRMVITYQNGCFQTFYFNVYKNILDPQVQVQHKICATTGSILVTNVPASGYEFSLDAAGPFTAHPFFDNLLPELYTVYIRATGFAGNPNQCTFKVQDVEVKEMVPAMAVTWESPVCTAGPGSIRVIMTEGAPQYRYRLYQGSSLIADSGLLNGSDDDEYTFTGVNPGLYTVKATIDAGCEPTEDGEITSPDPLVVAANVTREITCEPGEVTLSLSGGTAPFTYEFNGSVVPDALIPVTTPGTFPILVRDAKGCEATTDVTVEAPIAPEFTVAGSAVACYNAAAGTIAFSVTNDYGFTLEYSINNGASYQDSGLFTNLVPNTYQVLIRYVVRTITDPSGGVTDVYCQSPVQSVIVSGPYQPLQASVGVAKDISCDPVTHKAEVHITNAEGGAVPYTYSFDGVTYSPSNVGFLGVGTFTVYIRDAGGCDFSMPITIEPEPAPPVFTPEIRYHCDGTAEVTLHNDSMDYTYAYTIDGGPRQTGNIFPGILPGSHEIISYYTAIRPPNNSILLHEDFGSGPNTSIPNIDPVYCYESQTLAKTCGPNIELNDGEYCVTQALNPNNVSWVDARDHTGNANGRFLALNVGSVAGLQGIIYEKQIRDIYPNQDLITSMYAMNLLRSPTSQSPPNILVQLVDNTGAVVASQDTGNIPSNTIWNQYEIHLNPGPNSQLKLVIRTNSIVMDGNDLALDDIEVYQIPEICEREHHTALNIEDKKFEVQLISVSGVSCKGAADGTVTIRVKNNGNLETGEPYYGISTDNGVTWYSAEDPIFTLADNFGPGTHTIQVQNSYLTGTCIVPLTFTITEPETLEMTKVVSDKTCISGGSVTIAATGGTLPYAYVLTDPDGNVSTGSSTGASCFFDALTIPGMYEIQVTDNSNCQVFDTFEIKDPEALTVTVSAASNLCSGASGATIGVAVAGGVAPYRYALNGGAAQDSPVFAGLVPGDYTISVTDAYGCGGTVTQTIEPGLVANAVFSKNLDCSPAPEAEISITLSGGTAGFRYQVALDGNPYEPEMAVPSNSFVYPTATPGTYRFKITDALDCTAETTTVTIDAIVFPEIIAVRETDPIQCHGGNALVRVAIDPTKGQAPFDITVADVTGTSYPDYLAGLPAGHYVVTLTDAKGCTATENLIITAPDPIQYTIGITPITCDLTGGTLFGIVHIQGVTGGTGPYIYKLYNSLGDELNVEGPTTATDHDFTVVDFGFYTVLVIDANNCTKETKDIAVASPPESLDIEYDLITSDCVSGATVKVTVGGAILGGPFEFAVVVDPAQRYPTGFVVPNSTDGLSHTFTGLIPGAVYSFAVYDHATGCHYFRQADLPTPSQSTLLPVMHPENVRCRGAADGRISFEFSDYDPSTTAVSYQLYHALTNLPNGTAGMSAGMTPGQTVTVTDFRANLTPGDYYVLFTETGGDPSVAGCQLASAVFTIEEAAVALSVRAHLTKNANCNAGSGRITAVADGGTAPYEYQLVPDGSPAPTIATWAGTPANIMAADGGDYNVYIRDANNCIQASAIVTVPTDPTPDIAAVLTDACATNGNFTISVTRVADGVAPYRYSLDGGVFQTQADTFEYTNLSAGTHTVIIRDVNDCGATVMIEIHPSLVPGIPVVTHPACSTADGTITMNPAGGSGNFSYKLEDSTGTELVSFGPSNTFTGLAGGNYTVILRDTTTACDRPVAVALEVPVAVTFTTTVTAVSCFGAANGTITVSLEPGNNDVPYTYSRDGGVNWQNNPVFTGLAAGNYDITVQSAKACTLTQSVTVTTPTAITIPAAAVSVVEFGCTTGNTLNTAVITIDPALITGGSGIYTGYKFIDDASGTVLQNSPSPVVQYTNTNGGTVTIYTYDTNGCQGTATATVQSYSPMVGVSVTMDSRITCLVGEEVSIGVTGGSGNFTYQLLPSGTPQASPAFVLPAVGTYYFRITDTTTNCFSTGQYDVLPFDFMQVAATATVPVSCFGASTGALEITISGYTGAYTYTVLDSAGNPIATGTGDTSLNPLAIAGVPGGNMTVAVTAIDIPSCTQVSNGVAIAAPGTALQLTLTERGSVTCTNDRGEIWAQATGGWGVYTYQLVDQATGTIITDYSSNGLFTYLSAGNYQVNVKDDKGCIVSENSILVLPVPITATASADRVAVACFGDRTATITAAATGGQGVNYTYTLYHHESGLSTGPQATAVFANLGAGTYTISVKDNWSCTTDAPPVTITQPEVVLGILAQTTALTCTADAVITVTATGGTSPYEYGTDGINFGSNPTFSVGVGSYQYYVRDANGCSVATNTITIHPVPELHIILDLTGAIINCSGEAGAVIRATANGGLGNYSYELWDATTSTVIAGPQPDGLFTGLGSGNYRVHVTSVDCEKDSDPITITEPLPLNIIPTLQNVGCAGQASGSISIAVTGGTGTIMYAISPNLEYWTTNPVFSNLGAGTYTVRVQDANGCYQSLELTITEPAALDGNLVVVSEELCAGTAAGIIRVEPSGGAAPYATSINTNLPDDFVIGKVIYDNLAGGQDYTIYIRDANGCEIGRTITLEESVMLSATYEMNYSCFNNTPDNELVITVNAEAIGHVTFALDGGSYQVSNIFTNIAYGDHIFKVKHTNGCEITVPFAVAQRVPVVALPVVEHVVCGADPIGKITMNVSAGTGPYAYSISPNNSDYGTSNVFDTLLPGSYTVHVKDSNGCILIQNVIVNGPPALVVTLANLIPEVCYGDEDASFTIAISGGVAPYATSLDGAPFVPGQLTYEGLAGGQTYHIAVRDANGCVTPLTVPMANGVKIEPVADVAYGCAANAPSNTVTITVHPDVVASVVYTLNGQSQLEPVFTNLTPGTHTVAVAHSSGCAQSVTFTVAAMPQLLVTAVEEGLNLIRATAQGGQPGYRYYFNDQDNGPNPLYQFSHSGSYTVKVVDANGCEAITQIVVVFIDIEVPNFFTPNSDGENDTWTPLHIEHYPNIMTDLHDRSGRIVATIRQWETWNGVYEGVALPSGDYWYVIRLNNGTNREIVGHVTIYR